MQVDDRVNITIINKLINVETKHPEDGVFDILPLRNFPFIL